MTALPWPALSAFVVTALALAFALRSPTMRAALSDQPNERSLHEQVTPRFGGLGMLIGVAAGLALGAWLRATSVDATAAVAAAPTIRPTVSWPLWFLAAYAVLALGSAIDDRRSLPAGIRIVMHLAVAAAWAWGTGLPAWLIAVLVVGLAWSMNLYNFMDGADGLAGGMAAFGFGTYAIAAIAAGAATGAVSPGSTTIGIPPSAASPAADIALASGVVAAAAIGFLCWNFPPARLFMGDAGSIPLGFAAAAIGVHGWQRGLWSPLFPLIVFFPFAFDATLTLGKRLLRGERVWEAHREHLYQRAVLAGLGHRTMTIRAYGLMALCATVALIGRNFTIWIETLIIGTLLTVGLALAASITRLDAQERDRS